MNDYSYGRYLAWQQRILSGMFTADEIRAMEYLVPAVPAPPVPLMVVMHGE